MPPKGGGDGGEGARLRVAIVNADKCKPKKCRQECKRFCPIVRTGQLCIEVEPNSKIAFISEPLCIGCGICVKKCPFDAIQIINLPKELSRDTSHRFGPNSFKLHRLPTPRLGQVLGLIGTNGIGKSTALAILSGKLKPNLGDFNNPPDWRAILKFYRGSELQNYFTKVLEGDLRPAVKPQYVDAIARKSKKTVREVIGQHGPWLENYQAPPKAALSGASANDTKVIAERTLAAATAAGIAPSDTRAMLCFRLLETLQLNHLLDRNVADLSGGELQRFAILVTAIQNGNVIMFDEPSSYLDIKQRIVAAQAIRTLVDDSTYVIVVEHDLAVSDYLSDNVCALWGCPSAYGVVTTPFSVKEGINLYLEGFIPTENLRFRAEAISFKINQAEDSIIDQMAEAEEKEAKITADKKTSSTNHDGKAGGGGAHKKKERSNKKTDKDSGDERGADPDEDEDEKKKKKGLTGKRYYPAMSKTFSCFKLTIKPGVFLDSQITVLLGQNGTGKTTFIRLLAGLLAPDVAEGELPVELPKLVVSYKPQTINAKFDGTVEQLLNSRIRDAYHHPQFVTEVVKPMTIDKLKDLQVQTLSGGELQRVALVLALGKPADVYLLDEPSAYLDCEQRIEAARIIKRFILHAKKSAFIVEHDFIMATYLADRVIVYEGAPGIDCCANAPQSLITGMNTFLHMLEVTFRRDPVNYRPRINKLDSVKDREQKLSGNYFIVDDN